MAFEPVGDDQDWIPLHHRGVQIAMHIDLRVPIDTEEGQYLVRCARIRDVTITHLLRRVVNAVARDQLVAAVLDDNDSKKRHERHTRRFRELV